MNARVFIGVVEGTYGCLFKHLCGIMMEKQLGQHVKAGIAQGECMCTARSCFWVMGACVG